MLTLTRAKPTKRSALRNAEYYDFQDVLDKLYGSYANLTLIDVDVHTLVHATKEETVGKLLATLQLDKKQLEKVNRLRNLLHMNEILQ